MVRHCLFISDGRSQKKPKVALTSEAKRQRKLQKSKLIVRNLSFKATEANLKKQFGQFGEVLNVTVPKGENGRARGFAFVQFAATKDAIKAIKELNTKEIKGRPIAVDFAVPKGQFEEARKAKIALW